MLKKKEEILTHLYTLLAHNLYAETQKNFDNAYKNRIVGFRAELDFYSKFNSNHNLYSGGYILPKNIKQKTLENPVYFTISSESTDRYTNIYKKLETAIFQKLFFIQAENLDIHLWKFEDVMGVEKELPVPKFTVYQFIEGAFVKISNNINSFANEFDNRARMKIKFEISPLVKEYCQNLMMDYSIDELVQVYIDRLVFDGYIGFSKFKGIASDIDSISVKNDRIVFLEIKEKDLSKRKPIGFGMDLQRINDINKIHQTFGGQYFYIVREVNNQRDRIFKSWHYISIDEFINNTKDNPIVNGGLGMSNLKENPTVVCKKEFFLKINKL